MPNIDTTHAAPVLMAHTLLRKIVAGARASGHVGFAFVTGGALQHVSRAVEERRAHAATARTIGAEIRTADALMAAALTDPVSPGVICPVEAGQIRRELAKPQRRAVALAAELNLPEVAS